jgi:hypothetical protein
MNAFSAKTKALELLALIAIAAFVMSRWFSSDFIIWTVDSYIGNSNPMLRLYTSLFVWKDKVGFGYAWPDQGMIFHYAPMAFLEMLGVSLRGQQIVLVSSLFALTLIGGWYFAHELVSSRKEDWIVRLSSALFYGFNIVTLTWIWWRFLSWIYFYPAFIIYVTLLYKYYSSLATASVRSTTRRAIGIALISLLFVPAFTSSIALLLVFLTISYFSAWFLVIAVIERQNILKYLRAAVVLPVVFLCLNMFHILQQILMVGDLHKQAVQSGANYHEQLVDASKYTGLLNVVRLVGEHTMHRSVHGEVLYDPQWLSLILANPVFLYVSLIPMCVSIYCIFVHKERVAVLVFGVLLCLTLLIVKGVNEPGGELIVFLANSKVGRIFTHSYDKFIYFVLISYTFFIAVFNREIRSFAHGRTISVLITSSLCVFMVYPLWTGSNLRDSTQYIPGVKAQVPSDYEYLRNVRNSGNWLQLPLQSRVGDSAYKWKRGAQLNAQSILDDYIGNPVIYADYGHPAWSLINEHITEVITENDHTSFVQFLKRINVSTILVNKDIDYAFMKEKLPFKASEYIGYLDQISELEKHEYVNYVMYFNKQYKDSLFWVLPYDWAVTYAGRRPFGSNDSVFDRGSALSYKKVSPTHYTLSVENMHDKQVLVFNQSYSKGWELKIGDASYPFHAQFQNMNNMWTLDADYIRKNISPHYYSSNSDGSIDVEMTLYFKPQGYFYAGLLASGTALAAYLVYLVVQIVRWRRARSEQGVTEG